MVQAFLKKWWVESDFKAPNLPLSLRFKGSAVTVTVFKYRNKIGKIVVQKHIGYTKSKKSLKIPKGQSESVYRRGTDNTMGGGVKNDKQRSTKHAYKIKDRVTRTPLKIGG